VTPRILIQPDIHRQRARLIGLAQNCMV
jgi:hypothetical protein